jgi:transcriptional regulator with XRE-family HTH domain
MKEKKKIKHFTKAQIESLQLTAQTIENGIKIPTVYTLYKISAILKVDIREFFGTK